MTEAEATHEIAALQRQVADLQQREAQYFSQKMEALARLSGGIAHDFNNLLMLIFGYCDFLLEKLHKNGPLYSYLAEVRSAGERAAFLTRLLMTFGTRRVFQPVVMNLNGVVRTAEARLQEVLGAHIRITTKLTSDRCLIKTEPTDLEQALTNIAQNAREAMPNGGTLGFETSVVTIGASPGAYPQLPAGEYVMLAARDTGCGMSERVKAHLFEPFFTTKTAGTGMGLGLFTVYAIVKQSDGAVQCQSETGKGTTVRLFFPRIEAMHEVPVARPREPLTTRGTETILLVEDDEKVRGLLHTILKMQGYTLLEAANGRDGLSVVEQHREPIDLLLTDVAMPEMNGRELAERAVALRPELKVIYMSGYTEDDVLRDTVRSFGAVFLQKPFMPADLLKKVREALGAPAQA